MIAHDAVQLRRDASVAAGWRGVVGIIAACFALQACAGNAGPPLTSLRERLGTAVRAEARARTLDERAAAVRQLLDLHGEIAAHPSVTSSGVLQGMQRQVSIRLAASRRALLRDYGGRADAAGGGATQALALVDIIQQTVHPDFWDVHGGPGRIAYFEQGRGLVVLGTEQVHDDVGNLLDQLRRAGP